MTRKRMNVFYVKEIMINVIYDHYKPRLDTYVRLRTYGLENSLDYSKYYTLTI